jgi:hypothetical protein
MWYKAKNDAGKIFKRYGNYSIARRNSRPMSSVRLPLIYRGNTLEQHDV